MTLEQFEKDLTDKLAAMTDEELKTSLRRAGCKFKDDILVEHQSPAGPYWYHPDHPLCQDGQVLWEYPEDEDEDEILVINSICVSNITHETMQDLSDRKR